MHALHWHRSRNSPGKHPVLNYRALLLCVHSPQGLERCNSVVPRLHNHVTYLQQIN